MEIPGATEGKGKTGRLLKINVKMFISVPHPHLAKAHWYESLWKKIKSEAPWVVGNHILRKSGCRLRPPYIYRLGPAFTQHCTGNSSQGN